MLLGNAGRKHTVDSAHTNRFKVISPVHLQYDTIEVKIGVGVLLIKDGITVAHMDSAQFIYPGDTLRLTGLSGSLELTVSGEAECKHS
jgi:hypothetical protein